MIETHGPGRTRIVWPRPAASAAAVLLASALLTGCVAMPTSGPIFTADVGERVEQQPGTAYQPSLPVPGASPQAIVLGFLEAMKAVPVRTTTAAEFLTSEGRSAWRPEAGTITYSSLTALSGERQITLSARDAEKYDHAGRWVRRGSGEDEQVSFTLEQVAGEWRISRAPDALVVPRSWFSDQYTTASLYFLDPSERTVVPEQVHAPRGSQLATSLVRGLLAGPPEQLDDVVRSAVPTSASLGSASVPVSETGVAEIALKGAEGDLAEGVGQGLAAQLIWTVRQVPGVKRLRLTWNGEPVPFRGGASEAVVDGNEEFAPWGPLASRELFGVVEGRLVAGLPGKARETTGPFGVRDHGVRAFAVSWDGNHAAAVADDGERLVRAPVRLSGNQGRAVEPTVLIEGAEDLSAPAFDVHGRIWALERAARGARVRVVDGDRTMSLAVPSLGAGADVQLMLVSPDATRLVLLVRDGPTDRILMSRVVQDPVTGRVGILAPERIAPQLGPGRQVLDLAWGPDASVAVMSQLTEELADTMTVALDGSRADMLASATLRLRPGSRGLASSPVEGTTPYVFTGRVIRNLLEPAHVLVELPFGTTEVFAAG